MKKSNFHKTSILNDNVSVERVKLGVLGSNFVLTDNFVSSFIKSIKEKNIRQLKSIICSLHPVDFAHLLVRIGFNLRQDFFAITNTIPDPNVLLELDNEICKEIIDFFSIKEFANNLLDLEIDEIVDIIFNFTTDLQKSILLNFPSELRINVYNSLKSKPYSAKRLMCHNWIYVPDHWNVKQVLDFCKKEKEDLPDDFYEIFIVDNNNRLIGKVPVNDLISRDSDEILSSFMDRNIISVSEDMEQEDIAELFQKYNLHTVPVIDKDQFPLGVILIDDILDVVKEEIEEDILALGGIHDEEEISDSILKISQSRLIWLITNLFTAIISASVINFFVESIQRKVILAVLTPIVASIGGNAGTQTMTITVRRIAKQEIKISNILKLIFKELMIGFLNGIVLSLIASSIVLLWFNELFTALVIAFALFINVGIATCMGLLIPLTMELILKVDPAIASPVFVTMVSDILGAALVLGAATMLFL